MFTILLLCQSFTHEIITSNSCVLAFFIMLCINPFYLHDIGFQLSFTAVGAIGLLGKRLIKLYSSPNNVIHYTWLITMVAISFISTVFTAPLVAHYFGQFTLISLISNLVLFPLVYLLLVANVFWWAFLWYDPINSLLTDVLNWTATTMNTLTEHIASLPFATIEWHPGIFTTLLFYVMLLTITYFINKAKPSR
jgi:competence protein ComEC